MAAEHHAKIVRSFWNDPEIKKLSRDEAHLLLYFISGPHGNMIGLYGIPLEYAAREAKFTVDDVRRAIAGPLAPFVTYDSATEEIFVHAAAKHQIGEELRVSAAGKEDNRIENVRKLVRAIHSPVLQRLFLVRYNAAFNLDMPLPDARRPSEGASKRGLQGASKGLRRGSTKGPSKGLLEGASKPLRSHSIADTEAEAVKDSAADAAAPKTRETWVTPFEAAWIERYGGKPSIGPLIKFLAPVRVDLGDAEALARWRRYLDATKADFASAAKFASIHGTYAESPVVQLTDEFGIERPHRRRSSGGWDVQLESGEWARADYLDGTEVAL